MVGWLVGWLVGCWCFFCFVMFDVLQWTYFGFRMATQKENGISMYDTYLRDRMVWIISNNDNDVYHKHHQKQWWQIIAIQFSQRLFPLFLETMNWDPYPPFETNISHEKWWLVQMKCPFCEGKNGSFLTECISQLSTNGYCNCWFGPRLFGFLGYLLMNWNLT